MNFIEIILYILNFSMLSLSYFYWLQTFKLINLILYHSQKVKGGYIS